MVAEDTASSIGIDIAVVDIDTKYPRLRKPGLTSTWPSPFTSTVCVVLKCDCTGAPPSSLRPALTPQCTRAVSSLSICPEG
ncbi:hypothetical protein PsYK624_094300 [Phanerochaete sordida]|uniref:Uncharacterized protein n=1 Tax=Phanerochaete sordida TaxID=48140 RepID=A0A9P3GEF0_9APHY|nr:hypothetical protein PsYK624_094300 [Phanerochaete sordida]